MNVGEKEESRDDRTQGATVASGEKEESRDDRTQGATRRGIKRGVIKVSGGGGALLSLTKLEMKNREIVCSDQEG